MTGEDREKMFEILDEVGKCIDQAQVKALADLEARIPAAHEEFKKDLELLEKKSAEKWRKRGEELGRH